MSEPVELLYSIPYREFTAIQEVLALEEMEGVTDKPIFILVYRHPDNPEERRIALEYGEVI